MSEPRPPRRVVLIGPECTGKTWLAGALAERYGVPVAAEHAREYVVSHGALLSYADVEPIARGQRRNEDEAIARAVETGAPFVLLDTDLVSTIIYSRHYYGDCPDWVEADAVARLADLYLLHQVDIEWVADGLQRTEPERREELFVRFRLTLELLGANVAVVEGDWTERQRCAIEAIDKALSGEPEP
jgi:NadR type nicotinamide-nucleotide adenylyltransferase